MVFIILVGIPLRVNAVEIGSPNIGIYDTDGYAVRDVVSGSEYVYAAQTGNERPLHVINITDPINPSLLGRGYTSKRYEVHCLDVNDAETILIIGASSYVCVYNITNKTNPIRTAEIDVGSTVYDLEIWGNYVYCAANSAGMPIVNITDVNNPSVIYNGIMMAIAMITCMVYI
ncbi:MAG: hypothetical protein GF311_16625 [Candidatus Lokiarchaeota archaeon]|nr:hypothetical protein [Candidatus Lokiarchaeota archaeon]